MGVHNVNFFAAENFLHGFHTPLVVGFVRHERHLNYRNVNHVF